MKNENPLFTVFRKAFPRGMDFSKSKVYHIKSFEYTDANMELYEKYKFEKDFGKALAELEYNSRVNDVAIYYVLSQEEKSVVYLLSDPFDLWEEEYIMEKYEWVFDEEVLGLSTVQQIN